MNQYDKQRISDAIWILKSYCVEIDEILKSEDYGYMAIDYFDHMLDAIAKNIGDERQGDKL